MKYYTGIGSRETPTEILELMNKLAVKLEQEGWTVRSGGANGADTAFERSVKEKQIFLPWKRFNGNPSSWFIIPPEAFELAENHHPAWFRCSDGAKKLHARNTQQVLGPNLDTPSKFLVCWTMHGEAIGGTATAIRLAETNGIEVVNMGSEKGLQRIQTYLGA